MDSTLQCLRAVCAATARYPMPLVYNATMYAGDAIG